MQFNYNGQLVDEKELVFTIKNRAFLYGDCVYEILKIKDASILFWEEHYFNLMASMRIFRMKIPNTFTQEFLADELTKIINANQLKNAKVKFYVFRNCDVENGLFQSEVSYFITIKPQSSSNYSWYKLACNVEVYKDFTVNPSFFSQVRSHKPEEVIAQVFKQENNYDDLILLNPNKRMARTLLGNIFLINENKIKTPSITEGGIRSVLRNKLIEKIKKQTDFIIEETEIFPFELQKVEEAFVLVEGEGINSISSLRKKKFDQQKTAAIDILLNS